MLSRFLDVGAEVVIVLPPLRSQQTPGCHGVSSQARCLDIQTQDTDIRAATTEFVASLKGRAGVYMIEVDSLLCPNGNPCPATISNIPVRIPGYDQTHFTTDGATWFAPRLLDKVLAALNAGASGSASPSGAP